MFEPNGEITFIHCDELDPTGNVFLDFATEEEQFKYFDSKAIYYLRQTKCTPQGVEGVNGILRVPGKVEDYATANYCYYRNGDGKVYYAYLGVPRQGPSSAITLIPYSVDLLRTWFFQMEIKTGMVEREHIADDVVGANIIPESVETGEFVSNTAEPEKLFKEAGNPWVMIAFTTFPTQKESATPNGDYSVIGKKGADGNTLEFVFRNMSPSLVGLYSYTGIVSGNRFILIQLNDTWNIAQIEKTLDSLVSDGLIQSVTAIKEIPHSVAQSFISSGATFKSISDALNPEVRPTNSTKPVSENFTITRNSLIDGYTPRNKKLLTGQFNYMAVTNHAGADAEFDYEYFKNNESVLYKRITAIGVEPEIRIVPLSYKNLNENYAESLILTGFPNASFSYSSAANEAMTNRAQNMLAWENSRHERRMNIANTIAGSYKAAGGLANTAANGIDLASSALDPASLAKGVFAPIGYSADIVRGAGNMASSIGGNISDIAGVVNTARNAYKEAASFMAPIRDHARLPFSQVGISDASTLLTEKKLDFFVYKMSVTYRYAVLIDRFFSRFGYATNEIKKPNIRSRKYWNFLKMSSATVSGNIPFVVSAKIADMLNNGICFYHRASSFGNFDMDNPKM